MKKLLLSASALFIALATANAQGVTTTSAYDDFATSTQYGSADALGIYWWEGGSPSASKDRSVAGKETFTFPNNVNYQTFIVDFGTNTLTSTKLGLNLSSMADVELDIENLSTLPLSLRIILEDVAGNQTQIEPNVSDCAGVPDFSTPNPNVTMPNGDPVYPTVAYNGFTLTANQRKTIRFDLSSVAGKVGGLTPGAYAGSKPSDSPNTSYNFNPANVHAVIFQFNDNTGFNFSEGADYIGSYQFDNLIDAQSDYTGSVVLRSFKIGSVLPALPTNPPTAVTDATDANAALSVFPNPTKDVLNVAFENTAGAEVSLSDISGNKVYTNIAAAGVNQISVNTSNFTKGFYILNVVTEGGKVTRKVTIQ